MSPAMGKTAYQGHILHAVVAGIAITLQQSGEPFQEIFRIFTCPPGLVIIKDDGRLAVVAGEIYPQIRV